MKKADHGHVTGCSWRDLSQLTSPPIEVDYRGDTNKPDGLAYWQRMDQTFKAALEILKQAHKGGNTYVMFRRGLSTLRRSADYAPITIRKLMRSKEATRYIIQKNRIQQPSVFLSYHLSTIA